jgi:hypothetical protein
MKHLGTVLLVTVALLALAGGSAYAAPGGQQATGGHWVATMSAQNGSGQDGTVTMTAVDSTHTEVVIQIANGAATPQPAHVHDGTCANLNPTPKYPLNNVVNGMSDTTIPVGLDSLVHGGYAVNVHKSAAEVSTYVSCGDTFVNTAAGGTNTGGGTTLPTTGSPASPLLLPGLALLVLALLGAGWRLRAVAR